MLTKRFKAEAVFVASPTLRLMLRMASLLQMPYQILIIRKLPETCRTSAPRQPEYTSNQGQKHTLKPNACTKFYTDWDNSRQNQLHIKPTRQASCLPISNNSSKKGFRTPNRFSQGQFHKRSKRRLTQKIDRYGKPPRKKIKIQETKVTLGCNLCQNMTHES